MTASSEAPADSGHHYSSMWGDLRNVEFRQRWIDAGGTRTRLLETGSPSSPPLLFLHGTGGHTEAYVRNLGAHASAHWAISMDMIGHGYSQLATEPLEIPTYVAHVIATLDALGIERASISGESLGGWVAARLAVDHPDRVSRLVLNTMGGTRAVQEVMDRIRTLSMNAVKDPSWDVVKARLEWLMADPASVSADLVAARQAIYSQPGMIASMEASLALQEMETRLRNLLSDSELARIVAPTLVLWTTHDPTAPPEEGQRIAEQIPGAEFVCMQDCGHWPQFEAADTFNQIHLAFLGGAR